MHAICNITKFCHISFPGWRGVFYLVVPPPITLIILWTLPTFTVQTGWCPSCSLLPTVSWITWTRVFQNCSLCLFSFAVQHLHDDQNAINTVSSHSSSPWWLLHVEWCLAACVLTSGKWFVLRIAGHAIPMHSYSVVGLWLLFCFVLI